MAVDIDKWCKEQSEVFDTLYNNTGSNQAPELDDYEKSIYLTKAQDEIIKNHFTAVSNPKGQGFDSNFKRQSEFAPLIKTAKLDCIEGDSNASEIEKIDQRSILYIFPEDYFLTVNEELSEKVYKNTGSSDNSSSDSAEKFTLYQYIVNPIQYTEYKRQMLKPYQYPVKKTAWRLFNGVIEIVKPVSDNEVEEQAHASYHLVAEVIGVFNTESPSYYLRYVKHPNPIILTDLTQNEYMDSGLNINGQTGPSICELGADAFNEVMQRAVELAKNSWEGTVETTKAFGERSE